MRQAPNAAVAALEAELGRDTAVELVASFLAEAPQLLAAGSAAAAAGDAAQAQRAYHTLKGLALTFGLADLAALCLQAETAARAGALPGVPDVASLQREGDVAMARLRPYVT